MAIDKKAIAGTLIEAAAEYLKSKNSENKETKGIKKTKDKKSSVKKVSEKRAKELMPIFIAYFKQDSSAANYVVAQGVSDYTRKLFTGITGETPTKPEMDLFIETAKMYSEQVSSSSSSSSNKQKMTDKELKGTIKDKPLKFLGKTLVAGLANGLDAAGDISKNNATRLAQALIAARSSNTTQRQKDIFGDTYYDKAIQGQAYDNIRKGENTKSVLNALSGTARYALSEYNAQDNLYKQMKLAQNTDAPSAYYDYIGRQVTAQSNRDKASANAKGSTGNTSVDTQAWKDRMGAAVKGYDKYKGNNTNTQLGQSNENVKGLPSK